MDTKNVKGGWTPFAPVTKKDYRFLRGIGS